MASTFSAGTGHASESGIKVDEGYGTFGKKPSWLDQNMAYAKWDHATARIAEAATIPFLLMQVPQIILNFQNLISGHKEALSAVQWTAQLTSVFGNLSLMSYFVNKKERGAVIVQSVGVVSTFIVLLQLVMAQAMPLPSFLATGVACAVGCLVNLLHHRRYLSSEIWKLWQDIIGVLGLFVLFQMIWSTFVPVVPPSIIPGIIFAGMETILVMMGRLEMLPETMIKILGGVSGWTATLLFMWSPVAQLYKNFMDPSNIEGLSAFALALALAGNGLLISRALFVRDLMWFTGATWGCFIQGWGILLSMYIYHATSPWIFFPITLVLALWLAFVFMKDMDAFSLSSPFQSLIELISCSRSYTYILR